MINFIFIFLILFSAINAEIPPNYYSSTEGLTGSYLKAALHNIIDEHTTYPYTSTKTDTWDILKETDRDPENPDNVILFYSGRSVNAAQEYNGGKGWSREHVWAQSHGGFDTSNGPGTDVHQLRPCDISVNSARGNDDFDNGGHEYIDAGFPTGCFTDSDSWEPRDAVKGDVARIIFYMAVRYEGDNGELDLELADSVNTSPNPLHGKYSTLMQWHFQDPVDSFEQNRNDIVYNYQHNRNPFIDHPEFATLIWEDEPQPVQLSGVSQSQYWLSQNFPNPFTSSTSITFQVPESGPANLSIFYSTGRKVITLCDSSAEPGKFYHVVWHGQDSSNQDVIPGIYLYKLETPNYFFIKEMTLQR